MTPKHLMVHLLGGRKFFSYELFEAMCRLLDLVRDGGSAPVGLRLSVPWMQVLQIG